MAEAIVGPLLSKLQDVVVTEAKALAAVGGEIETLSDKLMWLQALVHEADLRSRHDGSRLVRVLACQIGDVSFEAEDAVDEFYLKGDLSRRFALAQHFGRNWARASAELVVNFRTHLCVRFTLSGRIQAMNARLEEIINNNTKYGMGSISTPAGGITWRASRAIPHVRHDWENLAPFKPEVLKIEGESRVDQKLLNKLMEGPDGPTKVIRVVGDGGSGRRALLKHAYEVESIKKHFHVRVRVCFPAGISDGSIVQQIKRSLSKKSPWSLAVDSRCLVLIDSPIIMTTWSKVEPELLKNITGKGSKILLPGTSSMHQGEDGSIIKLGLLDKGRSITFFNHVYKLGGKRGTTYKTIEMNKIRLNILEITNGLPLAVFLLAKLMRTMDLSKWGAASACLMSHDEDTKLKKILSVSIDDLPDELKSCFLYTAGFPENRIIDAHQLVRLWMAEGFLTRLMGLEAEQLGQCYLKELIYRGLLQLNSKTSGANGGCVESVVIHDQIHPLLRLEAQHTSFMDFHYGGHVPPPANTRRLALYMYNDEFSAPSSSLDKLRTALSFSGDENSTDHNKAGWEPAEEEKSSRKETTLMRKLVRGSPFLRVMDLEEGPSHETELPAEIEEMVHLQYLGVRWRMLKKVPSSIGNLGKLQTLDVRGTLVRKLPKSLWKTKTLRHVLGDRLAFPTRNRELKLMQTLETVTIHHTHDENTRCKPCCCKRRKQPGLRFLQRLGIVEMQMCQKEHLEALFMELGHQLDSLSLSGEKIPMDLLAGKMLSAAAGARLRHVASLELEGVLKPPPRDHSCLPEHLSNLTRLVLRRTKIKQEFIHVIAKLPILVELEMQNKSYKGKELTFCYSHGFSSLTVLRIAALDTLETVVTLHSADSRRKEAIDDPIFVDMGMVKTGSNGTLCCTYCKVNAVQAYMWQLPSAAGKNGQECLTGARQEEDAAPSQGGNSKANGRKKEGGGNTKANGRKEEGGMTLGDQKTNLDTVMRLPGSLNGSKETGKTVIPERVENHYKDTKQVTRCLFTDFAAAGAASEGLPQQQEENQAEPSVGNLVSGADEAEGASASVEPYAPEGKRIRMPNKRYIGGSWSN